MFQRYLFYRIQIGLFGTKHLSFSLGNLICPRSFSYKTIRPALSVPLMVKIYIICLLAAHKHLFLWNKFQSWYSAVSDANLLLSEPEILFGVTHPCTHCLTLNHLIMVGKYFLYINALSNTTFAFSDFISLVQDKIEIEKYIAATLNGVRGFQQKWKFLLTN